MGKDTNFNVFTSEYFSCIFRAKPLFLPKNQAMKTFQSILASALMLMCFAVCANCQNPEPMNNTLETLRTRRSVRQYQDKMPEKALLDQVLEAGTYAPTGRGKQAPVIVAVTNKEVRDKLSKLNAQVMGSENDPFYGAPVVLVVLANREMPTYLYDGSLVMGNLLNAAHAVGLGGCWIHRAKEVFDSPEGKELLKEWGIEGDYEGIGNCIIGYPEGNLPEAAPRKADYIYRVD